MTGPSGHGWWAMVVLMFVAGSLFLAYAFSYLYLWTVSPDVWPSRATALTPLRWPLGAALLLVGAAVAFRRAQRSLAVHGRTSRSLAWLVAAGAVFGVLGVALELFGHWQTGLRPTASSYGAIVYVAGVLNGQLIVAVTIMSAFVIARFFTGQLDRTRNGSLENTALLLYYSVAQALASLIVIHGFPRLIA
jgi:cytochrome c oxidase subunit I+III